MRWRQSLSASVILILVGSACSQAAGEPTELLVFAASSLTDAFNEIEAGFELADPEIEVLISYAASSALRGQIVEGAPAAVFASASEPIMGQVVEAGLTATDPEIFATNQLQIAVPAGNPGRVKELADFSNPDLLIGLCAEGVPCGDFAREALSKAGVEPSVDSFEPDVRALLTKVGAGELDAGIVYETDVRSAPDEVEGIGLPAEFNVVASYPIVSLTAADDAQAAQMFVDFVLSDDGQAILRSHGFGPP